MHVLVGCQYSQLIDIVTDDAWTMIFMVQNESLVNGFTFTPDRLVSFFFFLCVLCNLFRSSSISIQAGQISCWQFPKKKTCMLFNMVYIQYVFMFVHNC